MKYISILISSFIGALVAVFMLRWMNLHLKKLHMALLIVLAIILGSSFYLLSGFISIYLIALLILVFIAAVSFLLTKMAGQRANDGNEEAAKEMNAQESIPSRGEQSAVRQTAKKEKGGSRQIQEQGIAKNGYVAKELTDLNEMETIAVQQMTEDELEEEDENKEEEKSAGDGIVELDELLENRIRPAAMGMEDLSVGEKEKADETLKEEIDSGQAKEKADREENHAPVLEELEEIGIIAVNKEANEEKESDEDEPRADVLSPDGKMDIVIEGKGTDTVLLEKAVIEEKRAEETMEDGEKMKQERENAGEEKSDEQKILQTAQEAALQELQELLVEQQYRSTELGEEDDLVECQEHADSLKETAGENEEESADNAEVQHIWKEEEDIEPFVTSEERMSLIAELENAEPIIDMEEQLLKISGPTDDVKVEMIEDNAPQTEKEEQNISFELFETDERGRILENAFGEEEDGILSPVFAENDKKKEEEGPAEGVIPLNSQEKTHLSEAEILLQEGKEESDEPFALEGEKVMEDDGGKEREAACEEEIPEAQTGMADTWIASMGAQNEPGEETPAWSVEKTPDVLEETQAKSLEFEIPETKATEEETTQAQEKAAISGEEARISGFFGDWEDSMTEKEEDYSATEASDCSVTEKEAKESLVFSRSANLSKEEIEPLFLEPEEEEELSINGEELQEDEEEMQESGVFAAFSAAEAIDEKAHQRENTIHGDSRNKLPPQVVDAVLEEIKRAKKHLPSGEMERLLERVADPSLSDEDYYLFASLLRDFYLEQGNTGKLDILLDGLERRYAKNPVIVEEVKMYRTALRS